MISIYQCNIVLICYFVVFYYSLFLILSFKNGYTGSLKESASFDMIKKLGSIEGCLTFVLLGRFSTKTWLYHCQVPSLLKLCVITNVTVRLHNKQEM